MLFLFRRKNPMGSPKVERRPEMHWDPRELRRWQDIPEERAKFISVDLPYLGKGNSMQAFDLVRRLQALGGRRDKDYDATPEIAQKIAVSKKQAEVVQKIEKELQEVQEILSSGKIRISNVERIFTWRRGEPTTRRPMRWWRGERTGEISIDEPIREARGSELISKIPILGQIQEVGTSIYNKFAKRRNRRKYGTYRQYYNRELEKGSEMFELEKQELGRMTKDIKDDDLKRFDKSFLDYLMELSKKNSGGGH